MATIVITAHACAFEQQGVFRTTKLELLSKPLATKTFEAKTVDEVQSTMTALAEETAKTHPGSLLVSVRLIAGRAPNGFRQTRFKAEIDRDAPQSKVRVVFQGRAHVHHLCVDVIGACWTFDVPLADYDAALATSAELTALRTCDAAPDDVRTWSGPFTIQAPQAAQRLAA